MASKKRPTSRRAFTTERILEVAADRLRRGGPDELTIRGIAGDLEMSPAALYRYFSGRDAILTALITRAYESLHADLAASHTEEIAGNDRQAAPREATVEELCAPARAYRRWGLANRHEFDLVFGQPIPGYVAPADGPTISAMEKVSVELLRPAFNALARGELVVPGGFVWDDEGQACLHEAIAATVPEPAPPGFGAWGTYWWATIHGLVALELNGQFQWLYGDDASAQFDNLLAAHLEPMVA